MDARPLLNNDRASADDEYDEHEKMPAMHQRRKPLLRKENILWAVLGCCLLALTIGLSVGVAFLVVTGWQARGSTCLQKTSSPSPVTRDFDIRYHTQRFNGSFLEETIYRQKASPEVDAAWEALGVNYRSALVPQEVGLHVGLRNDQVQVNEKYGGGYPANVEGLHHLHCLNLLRQSLYFNIDYYKAKGTGAFVNEESIVQKHVTHCMDIIRQQLMCTVDIGVLGQVWWQPDNQQMPEAFVDFNTEHVCRNYDDIRRWAEERQLPEDVPEDYLAPPIPGAKILDHVP